MVLINGESHHRAENIQSSVILFGHSSVVGYFNKGAWCVSMRRLLQEQQVRGIQGVEDGTQLETGSSRTATERRGSFSTCARHSCWHFHTLNIYPHCSSSRNYQSLLNPFNDIIFLFQVHLWEQQSVHGIECHLILQYAWTTLENCSRGDEGWGHEIRVETWSESFSLGQDRQRNNQNWPTWIWIPKMNGFKVLQKEACSIKLYIRLLAIELLCMALRTS